MTLAVRDDLSVSTARHHHRAVAEPRPPSSDFRSSPSPSTLRVELSPSSIVFGVLVVALAAFAGLTDVIPFVGGILATAPAALAALSRGTGTAIAVLVLMVAYRSSRAA